MVAHETIRCTHKGDFPNFGHIIFCINFVFKYFVMHKLKNTSLKILQVYLDFWLEDDLYDVMTPYSIKSKLLRRRSTGHLD